MKEIQVSKFQSSILFPIPINKGVYYFEFGYRKTNGEWRVMASQYLNLGYRIKRAAQIISNNDWITSKNNNDNIQFSPHQEAYQLSFNSNIVGSENLFSD